MAPRAEPAAEPDPEEEQARAALRAVAGDDVEDAELDELAEFEEQATQAMSGVPTREDIRQRILDGLESGQLDERQILADIYASQYASELMLRQFGSFMEQFAGSSIGARLLGGNRKHKRRGGE